MQQSDMRLAFLSIYPLLPSFEADVRNILRSGPENRKNALDKSIAISENVLKKLEDIFNKIENEHEQYFIADRIKDIQKKVKAIKSSRDDYEICRAVAYIGCCSNIVENYYSSWISEPV